MQTPEPLIELRKNNEPVQDARNRLYFEGDSCGTNPSQPRELVPEATYTYSRQNHATVLIDGCLALGFLSTLFAGGVCAHPRSGIVVDQKGQVFFQDTVGGVIWKIDQQGKLTKYSEVKGGHCLALDGRCKATSQMQSERG